MKQLFLIALLCIGQPFIWGQTQAEEVAKEKAAASGANMHKVDVTGLEVPNNRSQDTFRIVIKAKGGALNGCTFEQTVTINRLETMKAEVEYTGEWSTTECNKAKYNFTIPYI